jgi:hypothetical protein
MAETDETEWPPHLEALVAAPANHQQTDGTWLWVIDQPSIAN